MSPNSELEARYGLQSEVKCRTRCEISTQQSLAKQKID